MNTPPGHVHILGIGGTFMAGLARLAVERGWQVTGADQALYPPMSTQLGALGIVVHEGYDAAAVPAAADVIVIGNALSRGNPALEHVLDAGLPYLSGPEWLARHVLPGRHVVAIAGTHGKTTVSSLVTWMLECAGGAPGFLVGGMLENFQASARLGTGPCFVIEADEYDTAFFDKRSKFVHYRPRTLVINNLEFDHADIFPDLAAIQTQFHHLVRALPRTATILRPSPAPSIDAVLERGCWSQVQRFGQGADCDWRFAFEDGAVRHVTLHGPGTPAVRAPTPLYGEHNAWNVAAAAAAAAAVGVSPATALGALARFRNVRRRLEPRGIARDVTVYDDFAHHPTAIAATIAALRGAPGGRILAVLEPRSNTMRLGVHRDSLGPALAGADYAAILVPPDLDWDIARAFAPWPAIRLFDDITALVAAVAAEARAGDRILAMSNGAFAGVHERLLARLAASA